MDAGPLRLSERSMTLPGQSESGTLLKLVVYVCPECHEQIVESTYTSERGTFWGHYHDPPDDWPGGEDPWFDAVMLEIAYRTGRLTSA